MEPGAGLGVVAANMHRHRPPVRVKDGEGDHEIMPRSKGKRLATAMPQPSADDDLMAEPGLDRHIQGRIGDQLRAMYDELMQQPVPDRFAELLGRLEQRDQQKKR